MGSPSARASVEGVSAADARGGGGITVAGFAVTATGTCAGADAAVAAAARARAGGSDIKDCETGAGWSCASSASVEPAKKLSTT